MSNIETINQREGHINYHYNYLNELVREDNQHLGKTIVYNYDKGGNILSKKEYDYTTDENLVGIPITYDYSYADSIWRNKLTSFNEKAITYDDIGNMKTYDGNIFTWQKGRQLKSIEKSGNKISYKYNANGTRTEKDVYGIKTNYVLEGNLVVYESDGTSNILYTYSSAGGLISINIDGEEFYYVKNIQGDIIGLIDETGKEVVRYTYDSWGKIIAIKGTRKDDIGIKNPYRYRGYRYDEETKLYYLQSRYYNPEIGRYINADGIFEHNEYQYCGNNPINNIDTSGAIWETLFDIVSTVSSAIDFVKNPTLMNFGMLAWDVVSVVAPGVPGSYAGKVLKFAGKSDDTLDLVKAIDRVDDIVDTGKGTFLKIDLQLFASKGTGEVGQKIIKGFDNLAVHAGKQGKHIVGHNNFIEGKSIMNGTIDEIQKLINDFAGTGQWKTANKEMIEFGKKIGKYVDINTGEVLDTTRGIIHYSKKGLHIVPAKPIP